MPESAARASSEGSGSPGATSRVSMSSVLAIPPSASPHTASSGASVASPRHEAEAVGQLDALHAVQHQPEDGHEHRGRLGLLVQGALDLGVDPLEALLGEREVRDVLVEALEHRAQRRLGLRAALAVHPQVGGRAGTQLLGRRPAGRELAERVPALGYEPARERAVVVERRPGADAALVEIELQLGARLLLGAQVLGGLERELTERVVQAAVSHTARFRRGRAGSCRARSQRPLAP